MIKALMILIGLCAAFAAVSATSHAAEDRYATRILTCATDKFGFAGRIEVTENGSAFLVVTKAPRKDVGTCQLAIRNFSYVPRGEVPRLTMMFDRGACEGTLSKATEAELLHDVTLIVRGDGERREGRVQWLRRKQTAPCEVQAYEKEDLKRSAEAFAEGKWGK
jgi:hypothetical protein